MVLCFLADQLLLVVQLVLGTQVVLQDLLVLEILEHPVILVILPGLLVLVVLETLRSLDLLEDHDLRAARVVLVLQVDPSLQLVLLVHCLLEDQLVLEDPDYR